MKNLNTGIGLVSQERQEQIVKHGYTIEDDVKVNSDGQIKTAMVHILTRGTTVYPTNWNLEYLDELRTKPEIKQLTVIGAWACAEIDRLITIGKVK